MYYYIVLTFRDQIGKAWRTDLKGLIFDKRRGLKQILTLFLCFCFGIQFEVSILYFIFTLTKFKINEQRWRDDTAVRSTCL